MKKLLTAIAGIGMLSVYLSASALDIADSRHLGNIHLGTSENTTVMAGWVDLLVDMQVPSAFYAPYTFNRTANYPAPNSLPDATFAASLQLTGPYFDLGANGYLYLTADYGSGGTFVWNIAGLTGEESVAPTQNGQNIARVWVYNRAATAVPDGGTTAMLLGLGLSGLAVLRRSITR